MGDALFGAGSRALADAHAAHRGSATYAYEFAWRSHALDGELGATHAVELPFVFDVAHLPRLHGPAALLGPDKPPADLAARTHGAWVRFARTGDPGWDPYDDERRAHVYESVDSLSDVEERDEPVEVWIDPAKYPVPGSEDVDPDPDYYTISSATPCTADDEDCDKFGTVPAGTECGSYWVEIERYGDQCLHLPGDHKFAVADDVEVVA